MAGRYKAEGPEAEFEPGSRGRVRIDQCFTPDYLRRMHRVWLGEIYVWAGEYRQVNIAKGSFMFAAANQVPKLMHEFGRGALRDYTPCRFEDEGELATSLAVWYTPSSS